MKSSTVLFVFVPKDFWNCCCKFTLATEVDENFLDGSLKNVIFFHFYYQFFVTSAAATIQRLSPRKNLNKLGF